MSRRVFQQIFSNYRGLDLRGSDLTNSLDFFSDFKNFQISAQAEAIYTRKGTKIISSDGPYLGMWCNAYTNPDTGALVEEILGISDSLYKLNEKTFVVAYAGANSPTTMSILLDSATQTFKVAIVEDGVSKLNYDIGTGLEASPVTLAGLKTQIDGISGGNYTATITGTTTTPAALALPITLVADGDLVSADVTLTWYEWEEVNTVIDPPFATSYAARGEDAYEHPSVINMEGSLYIATGYETLHKWDGQTCYRAGAPEPSAPTTAISGAGSLTGDYRYYYRYKHTDHQGVARAFALSPASEDLTLTADSASVTVANLEDDTGFNTGCASYTGGPDLIIGSGAEIDVQNTPHTIRVGDKILVEAQGDTIEGPFLVTAVTATKLTINAGDGFTTASSGYISAGLSIEIYRNKDGGTLPYLWREICNNSFAATRAVVDDTLDDNLGGAIDLPQKTPDLLEVAPKYLREHQGMIVAAGDMNEPNRARFSDVENIEGFPGASNYLDVPGTSKGGITGLISDYERLVIGKEYALYSFAGDLDQGGIIPQKIGDGTVGIACHNSIADTEFGAIFLAHIGFRRIRYGQVEDLGDEAGLGGPLDPIFTERASSASRTLKLKRCWGIVLDGDQSYFCFVPTESGADTSKYVNGYARLLWFDWGQRAWGEFSGINAGGGMCVKDRQLYFLSKRDHVSLTVTGTVSTDPDTNSAYDYADHAEPIEVSLTTAWDSLGSPSMLKKVLYLKLYNIFKQSWFGDYAVTIKTERNFIENTTHSQNVLSFSSAGTVGWGNFAWGGSWATAIVRWVRTKLKPGRLSAIRLVLTNSNLHQRTSLTGIEYVVAAAYKQEMKE